ncbi:cation diffusion facilitator family transporter, partial [Alistipes onderdonkii]|uniref:cation diffusion facilitator family transporter n=1 Tax=Alistipes onderdonkii TaxID=328813 RepID=UPI00210AD924
GVIVAESVGRMLHPAPVEGGAIAWTAGVGVVINGFTAWLFMKDKDKDLNVKGAYLHMAADALVSVGVLVLGVVISWTGWTIVDPVVGLVVAAVIVASVWSLTRDSLRLSLDGVPVGIRIDEVEKTMEAVPDVKAVHHIHVW